MELIEVEDDQDPKKSRRNNQSRPRLDSNYSYVPEEIWYDILSRLNLKSLVVCQLVSKIWMEIVSNVMKNTHPLPLCGLLLIQKRVHSTYLCVTSKTTLEQKPSIGSGYDDKGLVSKLCFDFGPIAALNNDRGLERSPNWVTSHKGLLLLDYSDGTYEVHNPVTRQVFKVPVSDSFQKYEGFVPRRLNHRCSVIANVNFISDCSWRKCSFVVVRFCRKSRQIEMFYSGTRRWRIVFIDTEFDKSSLRVRKKGWNVLKNYVVFNKRRTVSFYFLTRTDYGVMYNFDSISDSNATRSKFPLPKTTGNWNVSNTNIMESEGNNNNLVFSYYDYYRRSLRTWKTGPTGVDAWVWVPQLVINGSDPLRDVGGSGREEIVELLKMGHPIKPVSFHPYDPILYLLVPPNVFSYHVVNDTLSKIVEVKEIDMSSRGWKTINCYPFIPCITPFHHIGDSD